MEQVLEAARKLAEALGDSERFKALRAAEKAVGADSDARNLLDEFNSKTLAILKKEQELTPVTPEEKREVGALKERISQNALLQELNKAQVDYSELMNNVNRILFDALEPKRPSDGSS